MFYFGGDVGPSSIPFSMGNSNSSPSFDDSDQEENAMSDGNAGDDPSEIQVQQQVC